MQKPHIIHFHFHGRRTGVTRSVENIMPGLQQYFEATLFGYGIEGSKISFRELLRIVYQKKSVIIHAHRNLELLFALFLRLIGATFKLVATRHAESKPSRLTVWLLKRADVVIGLIPTLNLPMPVEVIGHGIDTSYFIPDKQKTWPGLSQKKLISVVGRVRKSKGQHIFIQAVAPLLKKQSDWAVLVVGKIDNATYQKELETVIQQYGVESQVHFVPETRDIRSVYQASQLVVVPSFSEGFSLVPVEAMACACIVVATAQVGIHSELIVHQQNGFLFEKGNVTQLQELLSKIFSKELSHLANQARETVVANWGVDKQVERLRDLYNRQLA